MLYLGGIGTIWGPIIGAVIVSMLPELFRGLKELQDIAYASVLILILIFFPKGSRGAARHAVAAARCGEAESGMTLLSVSNVTKRFGGLIANDAISFDGAGEAVFAVIGPNGAGKTTLFNAISGFFPPTEGRIAFDGEDITGAAAAQDRGARAGAHLSAGAAVQGPHRRRERAGRLPSRHQGRDRRRAAAAALGARAGSAHPRARRDELLAFVGLAAQADVRADTLPYGRSACSRSRARSPRSRGCCCSTSRPPGSTPDETAGARRHDPAHPRRAASRCC